MTLGKDVNQEESGLGRLYSRNPDKSLCSLLSAPIPDLGHSRAASAQASQCVPSAPGHWPGMIRLPRHIRLITCPGSPTKLVFTPGSPLLFVLCFYCCCISRNVCFTGGKKVFKMLKKHFKKMQVVWSYKYGLNNKDITINTKVFPFILLKEFMILFF